MTATTKLFELAQLAEASYADLQNSVNNSTNLIKALIDKKANGDYKFSESQATEFASHWKVIHHQPNTSGFLGTALHAFSGTLFERIDDDPISGYQAGQLVYATRGTEPLDGDLLTDVGDISADGLALDQIVDMYNDWKRITAGVGNHYKAANLKTDIALTAARAALPVGAPVIPP